VWAKAYSANLALRFCIGGTTGATNTASIETRLFHTTLSRSSLFAQYITTARCLYNYIIINTIIKKGDF